VPVYLSGLRRGTVAERGELLADFVAGGLGAVKIFAGQDSAETLAEVDALRSRVPGSWDLMVDALWSYEDVSAAADARRNLAGRDVRWLECPLVPEDLDGHLLLAEQPGTPVALGEHFFTHNQSGPWLRAKALQLFQPDVGRTGFSDGLRQVAIAREHGVGVTAHMGSGSPIIQAAGLQFWSALGTPVPCEYQFDLADLLPDAFHTDWRYAHGALALPDRPGLGVEVDETALAANAVGFESWRSQ
jgi:L-alanine-DL-glutamate epimerase-like enolase superfamily enzyme